MKRPTDKVAIEIREVADDCDDVTRLAEVSDAEKRAWRSVARRLRRIAAKLYGTH